MPGRTLSRVLREPRIHRALRFAPLAALTLTLAGPPPPALGDHPPFDPAKPHLAIVTLGAVDQGKVTLTAAILRVLRDDGALTAPPLPPVGTQPPRQICEGAYETAARVYHHRDCSGHVDFIKSLFVDDPFDGAVLVVDAIRGPTDRDTGHVRLARQVGIPYIVVYLDRANLVEDAELLLLVEAEIRELLRTYEFPAAEAPIVPGNAAEAYAGEPFSAESIRRLLESVDRSFFPPVPPAGRPFLMPIEDVFSIRGRGTVVAGRVERGTVREGDDVEVVGPRGPRPARVLELHTTPRNLPEAGPGDRIKIELAPIRPAEFHRGDLVAAPGSIAPHRRFTAEVFVLRSRDGAGRPGPIFSGSEAQFSFRTSEVGGVIFFQPPVTEVGPGEHAEAEIHLDTPVPLEEQQRFHVRRRGIRLANAVVVRMIP